VVDDLPEAKVVHVLDGDTLVVEREWSETRIRLSAIDCPEDGQPWGDTAKYGLIKLVGRRKVRLEVHGLDVHDRTLATIYVWQDSGWQNVNERMVMLGHAWFMRAYCEHLPKERQARLNRLESWAKSKKVGLWRTENPIPPWRWRKTTRQQGW
jgi:endonuclease YncB( thermonuclease family)